MSAHLLCLLWTTSNWQVCTSDVLTCLGVLVASSRWASCDWHTWLGAVTARGPQRKGRAWMESERGGKTDGNLTDLRCLGRNGGTGKGTVKKDNAQITWSDVCERLDVKVWGSGFHGPKDRDSCWCAYYESDKSLFKSKSVLLVLYQSATYILKRLWSTY